MEYLLPYGRGSDRTNGTRRFSYSIVATCKLNGLDPFAYLSHTINRLPHDDTPASFLPTIIKANQLIAAQP